MNSEMKGNKTKELPPLTEDLAIDSIRDFFRGKPFVIIGTGLSCALDKRFGMPALKEELIQKVFRDLPANRTDLQRREVLKSLKEGKDLETSLDNVNDLTLVKEITSATAQFISRIDREFATLIGKGEVNWPASSLFERLVNKLPAGDPILHVLTPNYDTLFEHACDSAGIQYTSGYLGGIARQLDWTAVDQAFRMPQMSSRGKRMKKFYTFRKHVRLYKVHGSLNFFYYRDKLIENNAWMWDPPDFASRVMITPGISKHQKLQSYRQELLQYSDSEIEKSSQFLFLGYGFNDIHLESYIERKLVSQACKALIVTKDPNPRIESLLDKAENMWLVCRAKCGSSDGTRISNKKFAQDFLMPNMKLWAFPTFTSKILGG